VLSYIVIYLILGRGAIGDGGVTGITSGLITGVAGCGGVMDGDPSEGGLI
jgi:hypothetical protein